MTGPENPGTLEGLICLTGKGGVPNFLLCVSTVGEGGGAFEPWLPRTFNGPWSETMQGNSEAHRSQALALFQVRFRDHHDSGAKYA